MCRFAPSRAVAVQATATRVFVFAPLEATIERPVQIHIEVSWADQAMTVTWRVTDAAQYAAWLRECRLLSSG